MANQLASNPWIFDTVETLAAAAIKGHVKVRSFTFRKYAADTDTCELRDANDRVVFAGDGEIGLTPVEQDEVGWVQGLHLTVLDSGEVAVYIE